MAVFVPIHGHPTLFRQTASVGTVARICPSTSARPAPSRDGVCTRAPCVTMAANPMTTAAISTPPHSSQRSLEEVRRPGSRAKRLPLRRSRRDRGTRRPERRGQDDGDPDPARHHPAGRRGRLHLRRSPDPRRPGTHRLSAGGARPLPQPARHPQSALPRRTQGRAAGARPPPRRRPARTPRHRGTPRQAGRRAQPGAGPARPVRRNAHPRACVHRPRRAVQRTRPGQRAPDEGRRRGNCGPGAPRSCSRPTR